MRIFAVMLLLLSSAMAKDFTVNDQDQRSILAICDMASQNPTAATAEQVRDARAQISAWCVAWQNRINAAAKSAEDNKAADPPPAK